jgi:hypothetical protein
LTIAIVGGRDFSDYNAVKTFILSTIKLNRRDIICSGGAQGADSLGEQFADEFHLKKLIYKADWNKHGKAAGPLRNTDIVNSSDVVFAFPDPNSRGTYDTIRKAEQKGIPTYVYKVN